jgi:hypothetical protein
MATIRTVLTMAARNNWEVHQIDVKSAYLNATLWDDIHVPTTWLLEARRRRESPEAVAKPVWAKTSWF